MPLTATQLSPDELAELKALHLTLPYLRQRPWEEIAASPLVLGCLRNTLLAARRARAERARLDPTNFELVP
jgi:hypothetical protein